MLKCHICNKDQNSLKNLSKHLSNNHRYSPKEYYDLYLKTENEDVCVVCSNKTKYIMFTIGYNNTCSRSCGAKLFRENLKQDTDRFQKFRNIVSKNQERIWKDRERDGTKKEINDRVGATIKNNNTLLTEDELKEKYGWLNKLSDKEKEIWKQNVMFQTGYHKFWQNATDEDRKDQQKKRQKTMIEKGIMIDPESKNEKQRYYEKVRTISYKTYRKYKDIINPNNYTICRGHKGYHIDHIVSIQQGFINNIPPEIIGSIHNLQVLTGKDNNKKSYKNGQSIESLLEKYYE